AIGLSAIGIDSFMSQNSPSPLPPEPAYRAAVTTAASPALAGVAENLGRSAGFVPDNVKKSNAIIAERTEVLPSGMIQDSIDVTDCSGATFFQNSVIGSQNAAPNLIQLINRTFLGY